MPRTHTVGHLLTYAGAGRAAGTDGLQPPSFDLPWCCGWPKAAFHCCEQRSFNLSLLVNHMTTISQGFSGINS
jgi:hypothetical protein